MIHFLGIGYRVWNDDRWATLRSSILEVTLKQFEVNFIIDNLILQRTVKGTTHHDGNKNPFVDSTL